MSMKYFNFDFEANWESLIRFKVTLNCPIRIEKSCFCKRLNYYQDFLLHFHTGHLFCFYVTGGRPDRVSAELPFFKQAATREKEAAGK